MRPALALLALCSALVALPGCAALASILPVVAAVVAEAWTWLDLIDQGARKRFDAQPDPKAEKVYGEAMAKARSALAVAAHAGRGAEGLGQEDTERAFREFEQAYAALLAITGPLGIAAPAAPGALRAPADGALAVQRPQDLRP